MRNQVRLAAVVAVVVGVLASASPAWATSTLQITVNTAAPEQAIPVQLAFSGTVDASQLTGNSRAYLSVDIRPAGGVPCQATYSNDQTAAGNVSDSLFGSGNGEGSGPYSESPSYTPSSPGPYLVCAWLWNRDSSNTQIYQTASVTFTVRGPQVSVLTVGLGTAALPGREFQINYTTQTDQNLSLYSIVKPAGGLPCQASYELEQGANESSSGIFDYTNVYGGPTLTTGNDTETNPGPYLICTWIEGPDQGEVDAAASTPIYVGTPPSPPGPRVAVSARVRLRRVSATRRHGVKLTGTSASGLTGTLTVAAACGKSTVTGRAHTAAGRFSAHLRLPRGCRRARKVQVTAVWAGSSSYSREAVSDSVRIRRG